MPGEDELPPGPLRDLTVALHEVYAAAGKPSLAKIEVEVRKRDDKGSRDTVRGVLRGNKTKWATLSPIIGALAEMSVPSRSSDDEMARIKPLWDHASDVNAPIDSLP